MSSDRLPTTFREHRTSRRRFLTTLGAVASVSIAGCRSILSGGGSDGPDEPIEVGVLNDTSSEAEIVVLVIDSEDETLFSRVLPPDPNSSRRGVLSKRLLRECFHLGWGLLYMEVFPLFSGRFRVETGRYWTHATSRQHD